MAAYVLNAPTMRSLNPQTRSTTRNSLLRETRTLIRATADLNSRARHSYHCNVSVNKRAQPVGAVRLGGSGEQLEDAQGSQDTCTRRKAAAGTALLLTSVFLGNGQEARAFPIDTGSFPVDDEGDFFAPRSKAAEGVPPAPVEAVPEPVKVTPVESPSAPPPEAEPKLVLEPWDNPESNFTLDIPKGWDVDAMGDTMVFHPPHEYGGRKINLTVTVLGRQDVPSMSILGDVKSYAQGKANEVGADAGKGATSNVVEYKEAGNGRLYYYEYLLKAIKPLRVKGVDAVGLGGSPSAQKFKMRQLISLTCQVPEEKITEDDKKLLSDVIGSFRFTDSLAS